MNDMPTSGWRWNYQPCFNGVGGYANLRLISPEEASIRKLEYLGSQPMQAVLDKATLAKAVDGRYPAYSTNLDAAFTLGAEATRLGLRDEYMYFLSLECAKARQGDSYGIAHATAQQRATAFYAAWKMKQEADNAND